MCERERERGEREGEGEKERGLSLQTPAAVSHFGQAAADREKQTSETSRQVQTWSDGRGWVVGGCGVEIVIEGRAWGARVRWGRGMSESKVAGSGGS